MPKPKTLIHIGSWVLLILINLGGAYTIFQKSSYIPLEPSEVMLVRPGPNQDASTAATIASDQSKGASSPQSPDKVIVLIHSRYRGLQLPIVCISSVVLIALILSTRTWPKKNIPNLDQPNP
jgi:hypothetical protein